MNNRKSTQEYWEKEWMNLSSMTKIDPHNQSPSNLLYRKLHCSLTKLFESQNVQEKATFLEVGCGGSLWLPYFCQEFNFQVSGIDYTDNGVEAAKRIAEESKILANIIKCDVFDPPIELTSNQFDIVASFGFIEHFEDTMHCIDHIKKFLRPGGILVSVIPNMTGLYGLVYKHLKPDVYNSHKPITLESFVEAHKDSGLNVLDFSYLLSTPGVVKNELSSDSSLFGLIKRTAKFISFNIWYLESKGIALPPSQLLSPYIMCLSNRPV
jgi:2-polyprenyl-3-methyl-5-hydroxy-6-metoxy-1,4-benzoquinol methylase